jgi:hypothetical protein
MFLDLLDPDPDPLVRGMDPDRDPDRVRDPDPSIIKGAWQGTEFSEFFCISRFGLGPLHYISSRSESDFGFEFAEIFVFEKRLPVSVSR